MTRAMIAAGAWAAVWAAGAAWGDWRLATPEPTTGVVIVLNKGEASASLLNAADGKEHARIATGAGPHEVAVSYDGRTAVVSNYGEQTPGKTLTVIDLAKAEAVRTIDLGEYRRPHGLAYLPDGIRLLVTAEVNEALLIVDVAEGRVVHALETGQKGSHMVKVSPEGKRAYVANVGSGTVSVMNLVTGACIRTIPTGAGAEGLDVSPSGEELWVGNNQAHSVSIIDTRSLAVVETIPCAAVPIRAQFTPSGTHVLVTAAGSGELVVFDAAKREEVRRLALKAGPDAPPAPPRFGDSAVPIGILIPAGGNRAYVATMRTNQVAVIDMNTWTVVGRFAAGMSPDGLGFAPLDAWGGARGG